MLKSILKFIYAYRHFFIGIIICFFLLLGLRDILKPFLIAIILSFIFNKPVSLLEKNYIPRSVSSFFIILIFFSAIFLFFWVSIPILHATIKHMAQKMPQFVEHVSQCTLEFISDKVDLDKMKEQFQLQTIQFSSYAFTAIINWFASNISIGNTIYYFLITPFLIYYLTIDWVRITQWVIDLLPANIRVKGASTAQEMNKMFFLYIKGQSIVSLIMIILYALIFYIIDLKHFIFLAFTMGISGFIPYIGSIIGIFLIVFFAIAYSISLTLVLSILLICYVIESQILTPTFIGKQLGIPPLILVLSIIIGHYYFGLLGMVLAYPVTATLTNITGFRFFSQGHVQDI